MQRDTHKKNLCNCSVCPISLNRTHNREFKKKKKEINRSSFKENKGSNEER